MGFMTRLVEALVGILDNDQSPHVQPVAGEEQVDPYSIPLHLSTSEGDTALAQRWGTFDASVPAATPYTHEG